MQKAESVHSRLSVLTGKQALSEPKFLAPCPKHSSNQIETLALWNVKTPGKTGFSVFAGRQSPVAVPLVDLSIGAKLLTSSKLVFGTFNGDP
jgi:hypothetical protein